MGQNVHHHRSNFIITYLIYDASDCTKNFYKIKSVYPGIETVPEAINGFGLLQTVQHLDPQKTLTFNFVHFSILEFLAAHYVAYHRLQKELQQLLLDKFWNNFYSNMFTMYTALTKGQQESFNFSCVEATMLLPFVNLFLMINSNAFVFIAALMRLKTSKLARLQKVLKYFNRKQLT